MNPDCARYWAMLDQATRERSHPMRLGALATTNGEQPGVRMVVLRRVNPEQAQLSAYTDSRSGKAQALGLRTAAEWMFYDAQVGLQLRFAGDASLDQLGPDADAAWAALHPGQRREYRLATAPGTPRDETAAALADAEARQHFAVLTLQVDQLDMLSLDRGGHARTRFSRHRLWAPEALTP